LGKSYNIAFGERITLTELFYILRDNLAQFDSAISGIEPVFVSERAGDIKHSLASMDKARALLGYDPKISVREGLKKAINWYWENLK
jgi:UDP-N-acetylglucosamine 4-epimerase